MTALAARDGSTILAKVFREQQPVVVSNALEDTEFNSSLSVINLKLTSVMCVPLMHTGEVFGAIYVGNNSVVNLFDDTSLELLSIFAGLHRVRRTLPDTELAIYAEALWFGLGLYLMGSIFGATETNKVLWVLLGLATATVVLARREAASRC